MRKKTYFIIAFITAIVSCTLLYQGIKELNDIRSINNLLNSSDLPQGEFLSESSSKDGKYKIKIYLCNGGATVDFAIRGELIINKTSVKKDIYWDYHVNNATVTWEDDDTVKINGKLINLPNGKYDFREDKDFDNHRHTQLSE